MTKKPEISVFTNWS